MAQHARISDDTSSAAAETCTTESVPQETVRGKHAAPATEHTSTESAQQKATIRLIKNSVVKALTYVGVIVAVGVAGTSITLAIDDPLDVYNFDAMVQANAQAGAANNAPSQDEPAASPEDAALAETSTDEETSVKLPQTKGYTLTADDLTSLSGGVEPFTFAFATNEATEGALAADSAEDITAAVNAIQEVGGEAGYILIDVAEGTGIAGNLDLRVYGASSIKGPLALYYCQNQLETNLMNGDTPINEGAALFDMDGSYVFDGIAEYPVGPLLADSLLTSANDSFRILRANVGDDEWEAWLASLSITEIDTYQWFPTYSARESALMWLNGYNYLTDPDAYYAPWLSQQLEQTEVSYIRSGLADEDVTVAGKAGWIADSDPAYCATCDAGLITDEQGRVYLMSIMTNAPDCEESEAAVGQLARALWNARAFA